MKLKQLFENADLSKLPPLTNPRWKDIIEKYKVISYFDDQERLWFFIIKDIPASISNEKFEEIVQKYCEIFKIQDLAPFSKSFINACFIKGIVKHSITEVGDFEDRFNEERYPFKTLATVYYNTEYFPYNFMGIRIVSFQEFMEIYVNQYVGENDFN